MKRDLGLGGLAVLVSLMHAPLALAVPKTNPFAVSPASLSMTAETGSSSLGYVVITTDHATVLVSPATFGTSVFTDTQQGTCWQQYGSLGKSIPPNTSCTIEVRFAPTAQGTYSDTMTISTCQNSKTVNGQPVCTRAGDSVTVALSGTATFLPNLVVSSLSFATPVNPGSVRFLARISNTGNADVDLTPVILGATTSSDAVKSPDDAFLCSFALAAYYPSQTQLPAGSYLDVDFECGPATRAYLLVEVDSQQDVTESNESDNVTPLAFPQ